MAIKRDQADIWFSRAVRHRDKHTCQYCGQEGTDALTSMAGKPSQQDGVWTMQFVCAGITTVGLERTP